MIILPDTHGRVFWKDVIGKDDKIVFLGDYVDPYEAQEGITKDQALENFKEIIEAKKNNPEGIILLLGNHDFMYFQDMHRRYPCRHDYGNEEEIIKLFEDNHDLFQMTWTEGKYILSHAGIHPGWLGRHKKLLGETIPEAAIRANELYKEDNRDFYIALLECSWYRGGISDTGSMIWSDIREWRDELGKESDVFQIVGHTQLNDSPIFITNIVDIDCRRAFTIKDDKIIEL